MIEKILLGSSYLAQAIVIATIAFAVISIVYYLRYNKKILFQSGWIIKYIFGVYITTVGMITRILDIASWSYGGLKAWNIVPFVNESWKLMLLNTLMFLPMGIFVSAFAKKIKWNYRKAVLVGALISLVIEFVQVVFAGRIGDIDDIIFNTLGFLLGYMLEKILQKNLLKKKLGFGTEAVLLVVINGFLNIPFYEKTVSIGDMILDSLNLNSWSGNSGHILSYNGIHYTMIPSTILAVISWAIAHRHSEDYGAKTAKMISAFMIVCFVGNLIQILTKDSIVPIIAASIICAVISRKTVRY